MTVCDVFCWNCEYFAEVDRECSRHAPRPRNRGPDDDEDQPIAEWPIVNPRDFCGEFKACVDEPSGGWLRQWNHHDVVDLPSS